jgi:hypothetical protein
MSPSPEVATIAATDNVCTDYISTDMAGYIPAPKESTAAQIRRLAPKPPAPQCLSPERSVGMKAQDAMALVRSLASVPGHPVTSTEDLRNVLPFISMTAAGLKSTEPKTAGLLPTPGDLTRMPSSGVGDAYSGLFSQSGKGRDEATPSGLSEAPLEVDNFVYRAPGEPPRVETQPNDGLSGSLQNADAVSVFQMLNVQESEQKSNEPVFQCNRAVGQGFPSAPSQEPPHQGNQAMQDQAPPLSDGQGALVSRASATLGPLPPSQRPTQATAKASQPCLSSLLREQHGKITQEQNLPAGTCLMHKNQNLRLADIPAKSQQAATDRPVPNLLECLPLLLGIPQQTTASDPRVLAQQQHVNHHLRHQQVLQASSSALHPTEEAAGHAGPSKVNDKEEALLDVLMATMDAWETAITERFTSALKGAVRAARADVLRVCCKLLPPSHFCVFHAVPQFILTSGN